MQEVWLTVRVTGGVTQTYGEINVPAIDVLTSAECVLGSERVLGFKHVYFLNGTKMRD